MNEEDDHPIHPCTLWICVPVAGVLQCVNCVNNCLCYYALVRGRNITTPYIYF